jgi:hypothetical protein
MDKKSIAIIILSIVLAAVLIYIVGGWAWTNLTNSCKLEGANNALNNLVQIINSTKQPVDIKVGNEELICSTKTLIEAK